MKLLYLVRHAKSSWDSPGLRDHDRPLNKRGQRDAPDVGHRLALMKVAPELLLSSPAQRAYTTATIIASAINYPQKNIKTDEIIYHADKTELMQVLKKQNNDISSIMLFGHNPGFTNLANHLTEADIDNIPTCGVVAIRFDVSDWASINKNNGEMIFFEYPKKEFDGKFLS